MSIINIFQSPSTEKDEKIKQKNKNKYDDLSTDNNG